MLSSMFGVSATRDVPDSNKVDKAAEFIDKGAIKAGPVKVICCVPFCNKSRSML